MGRVNKHPNFLKMSEQLMRDLQSDAEKMGMDFIHNNFHQQGFTDASLEPWLPKKQADTFQLLIVNNELFKSINVVSSSKEKIVFEASAPYAAIHNEGGVLNIPITVRSRKFFWKMYSVTGNQMWKGMALTKKERLTVRIPKRQFMGDSETFNRDWKNHVEKEILKRFKQL